MNEELTKIEKVPAQVAEIGAEIERKPELATSPQDMRAVQVNGALAQAYARASTCELTPDEIAGLMAPFPDDTVEIRPHDGLIYIPHIFISDRLNRVLKPGQWALVKRRDWFDTLTSTMFGEYVLLIHGCFIGESVGGHPYVQTNPKQNLSDVLESTAAEALRRICAKRLSCGSQVWEPEYARQWVNKYGVKVNGKWERRGLPTKPAAPAPAGAKPAPAEETKPKQATEATRAWMLEKISAQPGAKEYADAKGFSLNTWPLDQVPTSQEAMTKLIVSIRAFAPEVPDEKIAQTVPEVPLTPPSFTLDAEPDMPDEIAQAVISVPRAGTRRVDYLQNPDTIGSLYAALKRGDSQAQVRLFGLAREWEPKEWTGQDGSKHPPSKSDLATRAALDRFMEWYESKKDVPIP